MKKNLFLLILPIIFLLSCERNELVESNFKSEIVAEQKGLIKDGIVHFSSLEDFEKTVHYLDKNPDFAFSSLSNGFQSFRSKIEELKQLKDVNEAELLNYFSKIENTSGYEFKPLITDSIFDRIVNSKGYFSIGSDLYQIRNGKLFKRDVNTQGSALRYVRDVISETQSLASTRNAKTNNQGSVIYDCDGWNNRLLGELSNFNIGIYQRLSIQVMNQRQNTSWWSWLDGWVAKDVASLSYTATLNLQPAGGPIISGTFSNSCTNCWRLNNTIDINIGAAGPTRWSNNFGSFEAVTYRCDTRKANF